MYPELLYFLTDDKHRTYSNDASGNLIITPGPVFLDNTPDGWQEASLKLGRNKNNFGLMRVYSLPLGFVNLGARIIRQLWELYGVEALVNLGIAKLDHSTLTYKRFYYGALNFSTIDDSNADIVDIQVTEAELSMMLKANENTTYEIPVDVPEAINVLVDGLILYSEVAILNRADMVPDGSGGENPNNITSTYVFIGTSTTDTETKYPSILWSDSTAYVGVEDINDIPADDYIFQADATVTINISGSMTYFIAGSDGTDVIAYMKLGSTIRTQILGSTVGSGTPLTVTTPISGTIDLQLGEIFFIVVNNKGGGGGKVISFTVDNKITIRYDYRKEPTVIKCLPPAYVVSELVKKITDGRYSFKSTLLSTGAAKDFLLTCGDAIRGFVANEDYEGPKLKTSFSDFFKSYNTRFNIMSGIDTDYVIIEKKGTAFKQEVVLDVGEASGLRRKTALDLMFNKIQIGWPEQDYNDINGRYEFNNTHTYSTPIKRISKTLDLVSIYRADPYGIEFTRINLENKTTTDSSSDNNIFILNVDQSGPEVILNRPNYTTLTGVPAGDTIFNVELSPKTCLIEHGDYIHACMDKQDGKELVFETTEKNGSLSRTIGGVTITENANYPISLLAPKLFLPTVFTFTSETPQNVIDIIQTNPYGEIQFNWLGNTYKGFIFDVGQQPAENPAQEFELLASPNNNMAKFIR